VGDETLDTRTITQAQRGDPRALDEVVRELMPYIGRICGAIALDRGDDAMQEAMTAVVRNLPSLREPAALRGWARRIAVREAVRVVSPSRAVPVGPTDLAAVPSIVYGILGLAFLVRGPLSLGHVVLAAGLTLALLVLPVVVIAGREAIRAVPPSIREGSMALGATKWQTIWKQVLPASVPGFATGVILAVSRAIGEAAPLIVVGGAVYLSFYPSGLGSDFTVLPLQIFNWISQPQDEFKDLAAAGMIVLLAILLLLNAVAIWLRNKYEKKW